MSEIIPYRALTLQNSFEHFTRQRFNLDGYIVLNLIANCLFLPCCRCVACMSGFSFNFLLDHFPVIFFQYINLRFDTVMVSPGLIWVFLKVWFSAKPFLVKCSTLLHLHDD